MQNGEDGGGEPLCFCCSSLSCSSIQSCTSMCTYERMEFESFKVEWVMSKGRWVSAVSPLKHLWRTKINISKNCGWSLDRVPLQWKLLIVQWLRTKWQSRPLSVIDSLILSFSGHFKLAQGIRKYAIQGLLSIERTCKCMSIIQKTDVCYWGVFTIWDFTIIQLAMTSVSKLLVLLPVVMTNFCGGVLPTLLWGCGTKLTWRSVLYMYRYISSLVRNRRPWYLSGHCGGEENMQSAILGRRNGCKCCLLKIFHHYVSSHHNSYDATSFAP